MRVEHRKLLQSLNTLKSYANKRTMTAFNAKITKDKGVSKAVLLYFDSRSLQRRNSAPERNDTPYNRPCIQ